MQNGQTDPGVLVERVRSEVRKRKLKLELETPVPAEPEASVVAAANNPPEIVAPVQTSPPPAPVVEKPRLKQAQAAVGRAFQKNENARGWPRFLRGLRRNQETINDSLIRAARALLETVEWLRNRFAVYEREQQDRLIQIDRRIEEQTERAAERDLRLERQGNQIGDLQEMTGRHVAEQQQLHERHQHHLQSLVESLAEQHQRFEKIEKRFEEHARQNATKAERQDEHIEEVRRQGSALVEGLREQNGRLDEVLERNAASRKEIAQLSSRLTDYWDKINARLGEVGQEQVDHGRQLTDLRKFADAQQKQTAEEQRQFEELGQRVRSSDADAAERRRHIDELQRQLIELNYRLIEYQTEISGRFERTADRQQQEQLGQEIRAFVVAQEAQTLEERRQLAEQQKQFAELDAKLIEYQSHAGAHSRLFAEQQEQDKGRLLEVQAFIKAQEEDNAERSRLLHEQQQQISELSSKVAGPLAEVERLNGMAEKQEQQERRLDDLQKFVNEQQEQTAEEQRQLAAQREQLAEIGAQLIEYQNDACARYHLTAHRQDQEQRQVEEMQAFIRAQEKQTIEEQRQLQEQQEQLAEIRDRIKEFGSNTQIGDEIQMVRDKVNAIQASFAVLRAHLATRPSPPLSQAAVRSLDEDLKQHEIDAFYLAFENQFRGNRDEIKQRLRFYLPIIEQTKAITGTASALDVGCGRGEWLELLRENGYDGRGIDLNLCMVEECGSRGLKAECADAIAYLRELPSSSLSLITGFHIVEHLAFTQLFDLFRESLRVLTPRGTAIFETPNPECPKVPAYSFYLDPTHRNPVPQELLCFAARQAGFGATRVERLQAYYEEGIFSGYLDYAGIFTK